MISSTVLDPPVLEAKIMVYFGGVHEPGKYGTTPIKTTTVVIFFRTDSSSSPIQKKRTKTNRRCLAQKTYDMMDDDVQPLHGVASFFSTYL
jgi:radical SAM superfamily enzyme with C-terminal helix-hairpin-helix motif